MPCWTLFVSELRRQDGAHHREASLLTQQKASVAGAQTTQFIERIEFQVHLSSNEENSGRAIRARIHSETPPNRDRLPWFYICQTVSKWTAMEIAGQAAEATIEQTNITIFNGKIA